MAVRGLDGLSAVKPERSGNIDHEILKDNTSVVGRVELVEAGVEASCFRRAGSKEVGLRDGVVGAVEVETDGVADAGVELVGAVFEEAVNSDDHGVCCGCWPRGCG